MESAIAVCADCDAKNPQWASINRGVFICDECNSIHRQLGRHISHTKHLSRSLWRPSQLFMVQYLALAGANRFWEHVLLESLLNKRCESSKLQAVVDKKPQPDSPLHPTKADFIRKKYLFHGFFKLPSVIHYDDLNQQLHASVRTAVLETSLYLLALGANPNYIHPVKGTSPVHVACQYEQVGQLELLIAYGGDVCLQSDKGITPLEIALEKVQRAQQQQQQPDATLATDQLQPQAPWSPLIDCLVSAFYELTDGLSFYLCRRVPNHKAAIFFATPLSGGLKNGTAEVEEGQGGSGGPFKAFYGPGHFLTAPKSVKESNGTLEGEANRQADARAKVCALDNATFEDLCIDVYDEAERRLTNSFLEPTVEASDASARLPPPSGGSGGGGGRPHSMTATSGAGGPPQGVATTTTRPSSLILFFLPPNTAYTSVRNQARQKLGRLSMTAFRALVVDVLHEAARRLVPLLESSSSLPLAVVRPKMRHHEYTIYGGADGSGRVAVNNDDEVLMLVGVGDAGSCGVRNRATNTSASTSVDDPVYDQVAVETEVGVMTRASVSTSLTAATAPTAMSATSLTSPAMDVFTESSKLDHLQESKEQKQSGEESATTTTTSFTMGSDASPSCIASSSSSPVIIESRPGNLPGSRRLHLAATGRLASHRASVPAPNHCPSFDGLHKSLASTTATIAAPSSVTSAESTFGGSLERCAAPTMLQQSLEAFVPVCAIQRPPMLSAEVQTSALCCAVAADAAVAEAAEEMRRLREEREEATQQLAAITARLRELEITCERLTEENNALKAAFSAGMVKTHEATRSSPATGSHDNPPKSIKTDADHNGEETKVSAVSTIETSGELKDVSEEEEEEEEDDDEEYNNEDVHHHSKPASHRSGSGGINGSGNYAVGSQCLDSGMLLRQGISLWARSSPPADVVEVVPMVVTTAPSGTTVTAAVAVAPTPPQPSSSAAANTRSYVNLQNPRPSTARTPLGKQHQPTASTGAGASAVGRSDDTEVSDDYTAPNETGTPSPAPVLSPAGRSSSGGGRGGMMLRAPPTQFAASGVHRSGEVLLEYSVPAQVTGGDGGHLKKVVPITSAPAPTASPWKHPPYERIVRGVECIIVRIRALLDAANGRRIHEKARSSQLIQAAVQDLVVLFPPISKCHPTVGAALTSLMANSQKLRLHCEATANAAVATEPSTGASTSSSCNSSQLITFAHEIASAAKTVLNFFQAERH